MENKELEKLLVLHTHNSVPNYFDGAGEGCDTCTQNILLRTVYTLAYKQGYMRAKAEIKNALPKRQTENAGVMRRYERGAYVSQDWCNGFNNCLAKVKQAITRKIEEINKATV